MSNVWAKNFTWVLGIFSLILIVNAKPGFARPVANDNGIEISGGFFHARGSDTGALNLDLSYGKYLTPGWEAGLRQAFNVNFIDDARDVWTATTTPFLRYNFSLTENIVPFAGGFLAWSGMIGTPPELWAPTRAPNFSSMTRRISQRLTVMNGFLIPSRPPRIAEPMRTMF